MKLNKAVQFHSKKDDKYLCSTKEEKLKEHYSYDINKATLFAGKEKTIELLRS